MSSVILLSFKISSSSSSDSLSLSHFVALQFLSRRNCHIFPQPLQPLAPTAVFPLYMSTSPDPTHCDAIHALSVLLRCHPIPTLKDLNLHNLPPPNLYYPQ